MTLAAMRTSGTRWAFATAVATLALGASAADVVPGPAGRPADSRNAEQRQEAADGWLLRAYEASRKRSYAGTFVVMSASGAMSSSRIWHVAEGDLQVERMESLSGAPRATFRRNDQVLTFLPDTKVAKSERRDAFGLFPHLLRTGAAAVTDFYTVRPVGSERVAGFDTEVVQLASKDALRYGYRMWAEKKTGFAVQLQTLDGDGRVLEQAAFSDLEIDAPLKADRLLQMMADTGGYRVEKIDRVRTSAADEGWSIRTAVPGFQPMNCYRRADAAAGTPGTPGTGSVQWVFSDGLATVSLFIEPYGTRPRQEWQSTVGVTQMVGRRVASDWWLVAIGEVPAQTLKAFAAALERRR